MRRRLVMPKCLICKSEKDVGPIFSPEGRIVLCDACNKHKVFSGLYGFEKISTIRDGVKLAALHHLYWPYAMNVILKKYNLAEAKRKTHLWERECNGKEADAFAVGKRISGSFHSVT
jgi:hypothetical protein